MVKEPAVSFPQTEGKSCVYLQDGNLLPGYNGPA